MKALTIRQPWASLIIDGTKRVENRTWATTYRGPLMIHAGRVVDVLGIEFARTHGQDGQDAPRGVLLGTVELIDVVHWDPRQRLLAGPAIEYGLSDDPWASGPVCWILSDPKPFSEPVPWKGQQGLFEVNLPQGRR